METQTLERLFHTSNQYTFSYMTCVDKMGDIGYIKE